MKPSRVAAVLERLIETRWPAFLWGPPGVGKSSIVKSVAASKGMALIDLRASLLDPTDLRGIPTIRDDRAAWCPPSFLPTGDPPIGILFLDEINAAPPMVQTALYQLVLDRRVGEYVLPDGWKIVAAGNRAEDRAVVFRVSSALANRFIHIDFEVNFDDWRKWAVHAHVHPLVVGFLALRRELLLAHNPAETAFPTPRSWEMVSDVLTSFRDPTACKDVVPGIIGQGPASEFLAFTKQALREDDFIRIMEQPGSAALPEGLGDIYALVTWLGQRSSEVTVQSASATLMERLTPEFAVLLAKEMISANPLFVVEPGYKRFVKAHGTLLVG